MVGLAKQVLVSEDLSSSSSSTLQLKESKKEKKNKKDKKENKENKKENKEKIDKKDKKDKKKRSNDSDTIPPTTENANEKKKDKKNKKPKKNNSELLNSSDIGQKKRSAELATLNSENQNNSHTDSETKKKLKLTHPSSVTSPTNIIINTSSPTSSPNESTTSDSSCKSLFEKSIKVKENTSNGGIDSVPDALKLSSFRLSPSTIQALNRKGIYSLFPIQGKTFDPILDGKDLLGRARTGTGKTLAFALPMVEKLLQESTKNPSAFNKRGRCPKAVVMAPTRELAKQVGEEFGNIAGNLKYTCIYGGVPYVTQCKLFFFNSILRIWI